MRDASSYRGERRQAARRSGEDMVRFTPKKMAKTHGKRMSWLIRHPKLATFYSVAQGMLMSGPRASTPTWRAVKKMMVVIATNPHIKHAVLGSVPAVLLQARHQRPSWRSYPHQTIDANLKVTGNHDGKQAV